MADRHPPADGTNPKRCVAPDIYVAFTKVEKETAVTNWKT